MFVYVCFYLTSIISSADLLLLNFFFNVRALNIGVLGYIGIV